ncbi:hypothetical protein [Leptospira santarosai]|uniref:hypothetical protein n=1 Tax=Leptospira santarosai TaxID=28183 RepID=UPI000AF497DE|nr:hypothetical protein [Leptospira santarosai]
MGLNLRERQNGHEDTSLSFQPIFDKSLRSLDYMVKEILVHVPSGAETFFVICHVAQSSLVGLNLMKALFSDFR